MFTDSPVWVLYNLCDRNILETSMIFSLVGGSEWLLAAWFVFVGENPAEG